MIGAYRSNAGKFSLLPIAYTRYYFFSQCSDLNSKVLWLTSQVLRSFQILPIYDDRTKIHTKVHESKYYILFWTALWEYCDTRVDETKSPKSQSPDPFAKRNKEVEQQEIPLAFNGPSQNEDRLEDAESFSIDISMMRGLE